MTQPSLKELFSKEHIAYGNHSCPVCGQQMELFLGRGSNGKVSWICYQSYYQTGCRSWICNNGECDLMDKKCTYDQFLRMCRMKEML